MGLLKTRFEVGQNEKHVVEVSASMWTALVEIMIDGREVTSTHQIGLSSKSYKFSVGDKEKHKVEAKIGGIVSPWVELFVDGKLLGFSEGKLLGVGENSQLNDPLIIILMILTVVAVGMLLSYLVMLAT